MLLDSIVKLHEGMLGRELTLYEYRLVRSAYYSGLADGISYFKKELKEIEDNA